MPTYTSTQAVDTLAKRRIAYQRIASLVLHLHDLDINLLSLVRNANLTVSITTNVALPLAIIDANALELVED